MMDKSLTLNALRKSIAKLKEDKSKLIKIPARHDKVYYDGVEWLDSLERYDDWNVVIEEDDNG